MRTDGPPVVTWQSWDEWHLCTVTCGGGEQQRTRICTGNRCEGHGEQSRQCNPAPCPGSNPG